MKCQNLFVLLFLTFLFMVKENIALSTKTLPNTKIVPTISKTTTNTKIYPTTNIDDLLALVNSTDIAYATYNSLASAETDDYVWVGKYPVKIFENSIFKIAFAKFKITGCQATNPEIAEVIGEDSEILKYYTEFVADQGFYVLTKKPGKTEVVCENIYYITHTFHVEVFEKYDTTPTFPYPKESSKINTSEIIYDYNQKYDNYTIEKDSNFNIVFGSIYTSIIEWDSCVFSNDNIAHVIQYGPTKDDSLIKNYGEYYFAFHADKVGSTFVMCKMKLINNPKNYMFKTFTLNVVETPSNTIIPPSEGFVRIVDGNITVDKKCGVKTKTGIELYKLTGYSSMSTINASSPTTIPRISSSTTLTITSSVTKPTKTLPTFPSGKKIIENRPGPTTIIDGTVYYHFGYGVVGLQEKVYTYCKSSTVNLSTESTTTIVDTLYIGMPCSREITFFNENFVTATPVEPYPIRISGEDNSLVNYIGNLFIYDKTIYCYEKDFSTRTELVTDGMEYSSKLISNTAIPFDASLYADYIAFTEITTATEVVEEPEPTESISEPELTELNTEQEIIPETTAMTMTIATTAKTITNMITTKPPIISTKTLQRSSKCIPEIITITEKETITKKETITVTVKVDAGNEKCAKKYQQCGGKNYQGPNCCESGSTCHQLNEYYSQCY